MFPGPTKRTSAKRSPHWMSCLPGWMAAGRSAPVGGQARGAKLSRKRRLAIAFISGKLSDSARVPGVAAEWRLQERPYHLQRLLLRVHPGAEGDDVRVVVLTTELGCLNVVCQRGSGTDHFVSSDLLSIARTADNHRHRSRHAHRGLGCGNAVHRVIVLGVVGRPTKIGDVITIGGQGGNE